MLRDLFFLKVLVMIYIKDELDKNYKQGISYQDYLQGDTLVKLSDDQIAFKEANPTAPYTI